MSSSSSSLLRFLALYSRCNDSLYTLNRQLQLCLSLHLLISRTYARGRDLRYVDVAQPGAQLSI